MTEPPADDARAGDRSNVHEESVAVVVDLGRLSSSGPGGAVWSLPHGGDLDANFVRLGAGHGIGEHVNDELDVLVFVQSGTGRLVVDGHPHDLRCDVLALVPRGARREVVAGPSGIFYLSVHRRRAPLTIKGRAVEACDESYSP